MAPAPDPQQRRLVGVAASASSVLTGPVLLGVLIDWLAGTFPWVSVAGVLLGMAGLFVLLVRFAQAKEPPK
jgi:F0F1-type ATP synthase assembly protein I